MVVQKIKIHKKEITLVGTAHVSKESVKEVKQVIAEVQPDIVAVELDEQRLHALQNEKIWDDTDLGTVIKEGRTHLFLASLIMSNFQKKIGDEIGVKPGAEMLAAIEYAEKKNYEIALVDRDIHISLKRTINSLGFWEKTKLLTSLVIDTFAADIDEEMIESLKDHDILTEVIEELSKQVPNVKKVLIDERDEYIAQKLLALKKKKIVAVVGAGHLTGITKILKKGKKKRLAPLEEIPEPKNVVKFLKYGIPAIFAGIILFGFFTKGATLTLTLLFWWYLINGTLAALGTLAAFGHPASIAAAFLAAPFTSLNPAIAAGWVAGYVEARVRKPKVRDFKKLNRLSSWKDYWKNGVTRILLVVILANLGSTIGTIIALPYLLSLL